MAEPSIEFKITSVVDLRALEITGEELAAAARRAGDRIAALDGPMRSAARDHDFVNDGTGWCRHCAFSKKLHEAS